MQIKILAEQVGRLRLPFYVSVAGLGFALFWAGLSRFSPAGLEHLSGLAGVSPLCRWLFGPERVAVCSTLLGTAELVTASCLIAGLFVPEMGVWGALLAMVMVLAGMGLQLSLPASLIRVHGHWVPTPGSVQLLEKLIILGDACFVLFQYNRQSKKRLR